MKYTLNRFFASLALIIVITLLSCGGDDEPTPTYKIDEIIIDDSKYTGGGTLTALYSTDAGTTYSPNPPENLINGSSILIKINNGIIDLTLDDFNFQWSGSAINPNADISEYTINGSSLTINVTIVDIIELAIIERSTGIINTINKETGELDQSITITLNGSALANLRGLIFNENDKTLYASSTVQNTGKMYSIDPVTMVATSINENLGEDWYGVSDLLITPENTILSTLWYQNPFEVGLAYFSLDGTNLSLSSQIAFDNQVICCGLAMIYGANTEEVLVSGKDDKDSPELKIYTSSLSGGTTLTSTLTLDGFPSGNYFIQHMVKDVDGTIYASVFEDSGLNTYLARIDLSGNKLIFISQIGTGNIQRRQGLAFIPGHYLL